MLIAGLACVLFAAGLTGCSAEMAGTSGIPANKPVSVTIMLAPEKTEIATATKAGDTPEITADGKIDALDIYIIDNEGKVEKHVTESDFTSPGSDDGKATTSSPVELLPGTKTVYAFANCRGSNFSALGLSSGSGDWTAVPEAVSNNAAFNVMPEITTDNGIPMSASTTWEVTEATETTYAIELVRMAAKMEITIRDERGNNSNKITSLTLSGFLSDQTNLFRKASGEIELPGVSSSSLSDWQWTNNNASPLSIPSFYLHETTGTFPVSMQIDGETSPRTTTLTTTIPRNRIYPLTIHLTDYSLAISGTYHLAAIGTVAVSKNIGNGYTIELPEGSSDIEIRIQLKENGTEKDSDVRWSCSSIPDYFTCNPLGADATLVLLSEAIPATVIEEQTVTVSAEFTKNGSKQTRSFSLIIQVSPLTDDDLTKAVSGHLFGTPQTIHIEL
ncbi:MAG: fimbrial protein [Parabacteroides gordonii]|uniref:fimbrial protein n=1 Tax=Parabacteroides gordonii TaxID=574930 RepID=UPI003A839ECD